MPKTENVYPNNRHFSSVGDKIESLQSHVVYLCIKQIL